MARCWKDDIFAPAPSPEISAFLEKLHANDNICIFPKEKREKIRKEMEQRYATQKAARTRN